MAAEITQLSQVLSLTFCCTAITGVFWFSIKTTSSTPFRAAYGRIWSCCLYCQHAGRQLPEPIRHDTTAHTLFPGKCPTAVVLHTNAYNTRRTLSPIQWFGHAWCADFFWDSVYNNLIIITRYFSFTHTFIISFCLTRLQSNLVKHIIKIINDVKSSEAVTYILHYMCILWCSSYLSLSLSLSVLSKKVKMLY